MSAGRSSSLSALGPNAVAGALCALVTLAYASGFATLIFGGALAPQAGVAVLAAIVSSCAAMLVLSRLSTFHFSLGGPDSNPSAILAITVAAIVAEITAESGPHSPEILPTVLLFLFTSTILCGLGLYIVGQRGWGRYVRYIPHQVVGGFLVGTGYLLLAGGWKMLTGHALGHPGWDDFSHVPSLAWQTAALVAGLLFVLTRRLKHFLIIPGVIVVAAFAFHGVLRLQGLSLTAARDLSLLLQPLPHSSWALPFNQPWGLVRWDLILSHGNDFLAMTMVVLITILLNATSLDVATGQDADFDQELKALGVANTLAGLAGGLVAVNSFNRSLLNLRAGATSRWAARICAGLVLSLAVLWPDGIGLLPRPVLTGLILYLGLSLLVAWLWDARREMPLAEYSIMVGILLVVAVAGIVPGVLVGVIVSSLSFVVTFSRNSAVKHAFTGATRRSNVERPAAAVAWLTTHGDRLHGFQLHGHLFFGTSSNVLDQIRPVLDRARFLVLDFWLVRGLDASSVMVLRKLLRLCAEGRVQVVFTGAAPALVAKMAACGLDLARSPVRAFPDLDHGLEWAEESLLSEAQAPLDLADALGQLSPEDRAHLGDYFEQLTLAREELVMRKGEPADALFIVLSGRVSIYLPVAQSDFRKRLRSYGPGAIVGEMGFYTGEARSADVRADEPTTVSRLTRAAFQRAQHERPSLARQLDLFVIATLAARLRAANNEIRQLL